MSWIQEFNGIFFLSIATILAGAFGLSVRHCLKSKCEHFSVCFGLVKIDRRVDLEVQEHLREVELGIRDEEEKIEDVGSIDLSKLKDKK
jgi:hypothetical protein